MNAPDKIYIEQKAIMYDMVNTEPCKPDDYEYIRKDALLEWAKEHKKRLEVIFNDMPSSVVGGKLDAYNELIDKLNQM